MDVFAKLWESEKSLWSNSAELKLVRDVVSDLEDEGWERLPEVRRNFDVMPSADSKPANVNNRQPILVDDEEEHTLAEIAAVLGVSVPRARQIQEKALRKLRRSPEAKALAEFLED